MIAIIEYCVDNSKAISKILTELKIEHVITKSEMEITEADKLILTGSDSFGLSVKKLHLLNLFTQLRVMKKPILGISQGMQLLCNYSDESNTTCLGRINIDSKIFDESKNISPHIGLNKVIYSRKCKLFNGIENGNNFFFNHSYYIPTCEFTVATSDWGIEFTAAFEKDRFYGVQFYPEKSGEAGLKLLKNFNDIC